MDHYNQLQLTPYGEAAAQEYPPRIPFLCPTYSLYLYTDEELKNKDFGDEYLMIGKVIVENGQVRLDDTYIRMLILKEKQEVIKMIFSVSSNNNVKWQAIDAWEKPKSWGRFYIPSKKEL